MHGTLRLTPKLVISFLFGSCSCLSLVIFTVLRLKVLKLYEQPIEEKHSNTKTCYPLKDMKEHCQHHMI